MGDRMKKVVGVTGSIGCGKSTVCKLIRNFGYQVIDCDQVGHNILLPNHAGYLAVIQAFGDAIIGEDGINRKALGHLVFNNPAKRELLNSITHPLIKEEVIKLIEESDEKLLFMECPLLFETDFIDLCDYSIVVYSDMDNQIKRLMERDGINFPQALNRIYAQMSVAEKMEKADFIIDNCHGFNELEWQTKHIIRKIEGME